MEFRKKFFPFLSSFCLLLFFALPGTAQECKVDLGDCKVELSKDLVYEQGCITSNLIYIPADFTCLKEKGKLMAAITCAVKNAKCTVPKEAYVIDANQNVIAIPQKEGASKLDFLNDQEKENITALADIKEFPGQETCDILAIPQEGDPLYWVVKYEPPTDATSDRNSIPNPPQDGIPGACESDCKHTNWTIKPSEKGGKSGFYLQNDDADYETALCYTPKMGLKVLPKGKLTDDNRDMAIWYVRISSFVDHGDRRDILYRITPKSDPRSVVVVIKDTGELVVQHENEVEKDDVEADIMDDTVDDDHSSDKEEKAEVAASEVVADFQFNTCDDEEDKPKEKPIVPADGN